MQISECSEMFHHVSQLRLLLDRSIALLTLRPHAIFSVSIKRAWGSAWAGDRHDVRVGVTTTLTSRTWVSFQAVTNKGKVSEKLSKLAAIFDYYMKIRQHPIRSTSHTIRDEIIFG